MNNDREIAKEYIDKLSTQDLDRILTLLNLITTKKGLYYENIELKQEIERLNNIINKAIVYIENDIKVYYILDTRLNKVFDKTNKVKKDLLEILKGSDKE